MGFDLATAKPVEESGGFDLSTAKPVTDAIIPDKPVKSVKEMANQLDREPILKNKGLPWGGRFVLEGGGATAGAILGSPAGPPGTALGGGLGYAAGKLTADYLEELSGAKRSPDFIERALETTKDVSLGTVMQGATDMGISNLKMAADWVKRKATEKGLVLSKEEIMMKAQEILKSYMTKTPNAAAIKESERLASEIPGYKPSFAEGQADVELVRLQKSLANQSGGGQPEIDFRQANREALSNYLKNTFPGTSTIDDVLAQIEKNNVAVAGARQTAEVGTVKAGQKLNVTGKQESGRSVIDQIEAARIPAKEQASAGYRNLPNNPIIPQKTKDAVDALEVDFRPGDEEVYPSRAIARINEMLSPPKDVNLKRGTFNDVASQVNETLPVNQALNEIKKSGGINYDSLRGKGYSPEQISDLVKRRPGLVSKNGKANLDEIAADNSFESGDDLMSSILDANPQAALSKSLQSQQADAIAKGVAGEVTTPGFQDLHSLRKDIGRQAYDAMMGARPNRELAMKLNRLKSALDDDIEAGMFPDNAYVAARQAYADYAQRFRSGAVEQVLRRGQQASGRNIPDALIGKRMFTPDGADDFIRAVGKQNAAISMEGFAANDLLEKATNKTTQELIPSALNSWVAKNKVVLDKFGITDNFTNLANAHATLEAAKKAEAAYGKTVAAKMLNTDPTKHVDPEQAIKVAFSGAAGKSTGATMKQLMDQVRSSPEAIVGLKNAFSKFMETESLNVANALTGGKQISNAKIQDVLAKYDPAMKVLYGEKSLEYRALKNVQSAVETSYRSIPSPLGGAQSSTTEQALSAVDLLSKTVGMPGLKLGPIGSFAVRLAQKGLGIFTKLNDKEIVSVLRRAMYDPDLAKDLLSAKRGLVPREVERRIGSKIAAMGIIAGKNALDSKGE